FPQPSLSPASILVPHQSSLPNLVFYIPNLLLRTTTRSRCFLTSPSRFHTFPLFSSAPSTAPNPSSPPSSFSSPSHSPATSKPTNSSTTRQVLQ
ncbi:hypothetical protein S83_072247, partial [Arachis hypogaea]